MPTVKLNKKVFENLVGKKLALDSLKDRISMLGTDLESIEGNEITVEVFPNRPDMLSEQGFARALSSFIGVNTGLRKYTVKKSDYKVVVDKSVSMRPFTACAVVKNLKFNDESIREIMQIQEKLATTHGRNRKKSAYGLYPLKSINFPIKYVALDPKTVKFKPLGFDKEISADKVEELHAKGKEYKWIAEGWNKYPFFVDAKNNIMCMLPYTNSQDTGKIDESTKEVFVECTGTDFKNVMFALNIISTMLADMGGDVYSVDVVYHDKTVATPDLSSKKMKLSLDYANKVLGLELKENDAKKLLERMGFGYENKLVLVPVYRADILHEIDLVEDISVAYGFENFEPVIPNVMTIGREDDFEIFKNKIADIFVGLGFLECFTNHITNKDLQTKSMNVIHDIVELSNSVSAEVNSLRYWMLPCLLQVLSENKHYEFPQKLFDAGIVFRKDNSTETNIKEDCSLSVVVSHEKTDYTEIKQVLEHLFSCLDLKFELKETEHKSFIPGRTAKVIIDNKEIAFLGEIHPQILTNFNLELPVIALELNLSELFKMLKK